MQTFLGMRSRILAIAALFMLTVPSVAFGHTRVGAVPSAMVTTFEVQDEVDPYNEENCFELGELEIAFHTDNGGTPQVGIVLTDPRGRRIGFDPLTKHGWQELPEADGEIDCDSSNGRHKCSGLVQVCGPITGLYELEIIARGTSNYTVTVSARSEEIRDKQDFRSSDSNAGLNNIAIRKGSRDVISLSYSRDPARKVAAHLQRHANGRD